MRYFYPLIFSLFFIGVGLSVGVPAMAQEAELTPQVEPAPSAEKELLRQQLENEIFRLEKELNNLNELNLRRLDIVEQQIVQSKYHIDRVILILALSMLLVFLLFASNIRIRQKATDERVAKAIEDAKNLMQDISRELARPEMEYLRVSQLLRRLMRRLRSSEERTATSKEQIVEVRKASNDPFLPTALHFIARVLEAEYDQRWNIALQMLDQLREMDAKDPDVLIHLSHVHKNLAEQAGDRKIRNRHQRLSYEFYAQFTAVMQSEDVSEFLALSQEIEGSDDVSMPLDAAADDVAELTDSEEEALPVLKEEMVAVSEKAVSEKAVPKKAGDKKAAAAKAVAKKTTLAPAVAASVPPEVVAEEREEVKEVKEVAAVAKVAKGVAPAPTAFKTPVQAVVAKTATPPAKTIVKQMAQAQTPVQAGKDFVSTIKKQWGHLEVKKKSMGIVQKTLSKSLNSAVGTALRGGGGKDVVLPFLPVPTLSEVPAKGKPEEIMMWNLIRNGDLHMQKATTVGSLRERNSLIDKAITCYTQAQANKTNEVLYQNWGITLLAKALHVSEKKQAPFYNAAIDKFMAGNVVVPHYFDFHIASLYAIIGNAEECLKWLKISQDNDVLDVDALKNAPDFDQMRNEPWFDQLLNG